MADVKISAIAENASPDLNDLLYVVTSDASLTSNRATIANVLKNATNIIPAAATEAGIRSAIASAANGDAILLPAGTINIGSGFLIDKQIKIIGQGQLATVINGTSSLTFFDVTTDGFVLSGMKLTRSNTNNAISGISVTAPSTQSFDGENIHISDIWMIWTNGVAGEAAGNGITLNNAGGTIRNALIQLSAVSPDESDQTRGIFHRVDSNNTLATTCRVFDSRVEITHNAGAADVIARCFMGWNNGNGSSFRNENILQNVVLIGSAPITTQVEALELQGSLVNADIINCYLDGCNLDITNQQDARIDDSANLNIHNSAFARYQLNAADGKVNKFGVLLGQGVKLDSAQKANPNSTPGAAGTNPGGIIVVGGEGADNSVTTFGSGGLGALFSLDLGKGGSCISANTTAVGGQGGYFKTILGDGGSITTTSGSNVGGPGGYFMLKAGEGGDASGGTSNIGGRGGSIYLIPGSGGTGATASGSNGALYLSTDTKGRRVGRIFVGTSEGLAAGSGITIKDFDLQLSVASVSSTTATGIVSSSIESNNILRVNGNGGPFTIARTPNIDSSYSGKFLYLLGNNVTNTLTFQDEINLPGSQLNLGGYNISMNSGQAMLLLYNTVSNRWEKIGDSNKKNFTLNTRIADSGNVTGGEDDLLVYSMSANHLLNVNQSVDYKAWGVTGSNGLGKRIKFYFGGHNLLDSGIVSENSGAWVFNSTIVRIAVNSQQCISQFFIGNTALHILSESNEDLSTMLALKVTGSSSTSSSNDVIQTGHRIHFYNNNG